jgi:hypothetical protein
MSPEVAIDPPCEGDEVLASSATLILPAINAESEPTTFLFRTLNHRLHLIRSFRMPLFHDTSDNFAAADSVSWHPFLPPPPCPATLP